MSPFTVVCHPLPLDLAVAAPGQTVSASLDIRRSDGAPIRQFFMAFPKETPRGMVLCPRRYDDEHCRVDVTWQVPADGEMDLRATTFEVSVDGVSVTVPVRLGPPPQHERDAAEPSAGYGWAQKAALVGAACAGCAALLITLWGRQGLGVRPAAVVAGGASAPPAVRPPLSAPAGPRRASPLPRVSRVRTWRGVSLWDVDGRLVVDTRRRPVRAGDAFESLGTRPGGLPGALHFDGIRFIRRPVPIVLDRGREKFIVFQRPPVVPAPAPSRAQQRRRRNLAPIAAFLRAEARRARSGSAGADVLDRYRRTFRHRSPFQGDYRTWYVRLAGTVAQKRGGVASRGADLNRLAAEAEGAAGSGGVAAAKPAPPPRPVPAYRRVESALVLIAGRPGAADRILRPLGTGDTGRFYGLRLSTPVEIAGKRYIRIFATQPFELAARLSLPRYVLRPEGVARVLPRDIPAAGDGAQALALPGLRVPVRLVVEARVRPAPPESAPSGASLTEP